MQARRWPSHSIIFALFLLFSATFLSVGCSRGIDNIDKIPPIFNGIKTASLNSGNLVFLTWDQGTDEVTSQDKLKYYIYRSTSQDNVFDSGNRISPALTGTASGFATNVLANTTYYFGVRCADENKNTETNTQTKRLATLGYSIFGRTLGQNNIPIPNMPIILSGTGSSVCTTDANGDFAFFNLPVGTYQVTPLFTNYGFIPTSATATITATSGFPSPAYFISSAGLYSISGTLSGSVEIGESILVAIYTFETITSYNYTKYAAYQVINPTTLTPSYSVPTSEPGTYFAMAFWPYTAGITHLGAYGSSEGFTGGITLETGITLESENAHFDGADIQIFFMGD
jgi:hypothetical protein